MNDEVMETEMVLVPKHEPTTEMRNAYNNKRFPIKANHQGDLSVTAYRAMMEAAPEYIDPRAPNIEFSKHGIEVLRLDERGMIYKGKRVEDAGEAYRAWMEVMEIMKERN